MTKKEAFSGKFVLRIPTDFHRKLSRLADQKGESLNQFCFEKLKTSIQLSSTWGGTPESTSFHLRIAEVLRLAGLPLIGIVLFGSSVRGEARESSDIDLLLVLEKNRPLMRNLYLLWDSCLSQFNMDSKLATDSEFASKLSPQFVHLPESPLDAGSLWFECAIEGLILCDTEFKIGKFLSRIRLAVLQGEIKREMSHGHHYWIKNAK